MRSVCGNSGTNSPENHGQLCHGGTVPPGPLVLRKFGAVAKVLWPVKTAAHLAYIANSTERTASRWIAGEFEPPAVVLAAVLIEITRRS